MSKYRNGLFYSREDEVSEDVPAGDGGTAAAILEANEAGQEVTDLTAAIEDAVEGADQIEAVADTMEEAVPEGGVEPAAAEIAEIAVEGICRRIGLPYRRMSMESFSRRSSRKRATELAVESFTDTVKKIWDRILRVIKDTWEKVKDFFKKLFDANERVRARAGDIYARAVAIKVKAKDNKKIDVGSWAKKVAYQGSQTIDKAMVDRAADQFKGMTKTLETSIKTAISMIKKADGWETAAGKDGDFDPEKARTSILPLINSFSKTPAEFKDNTAMASSDELPGGLVLRADVEIKENGAFSVSAKTETVGDGVDIDKIKSFELFTADQIKDSAEKVKNICGVVDTSRTLINDMDKYYKDVQSTINSITRTLDSASNREGSESKEEAKRHRFVQHVVTGSNAVVSTVCKEFNAVAVGWGDGVCTMLEKMLDEHGEGKDRTDAPKKA